MNLTQVYTIISEYPLIWFDSDYVFFIPRIPDKRFLNFLTFIAEKHRLVLQDS